MTHQFLVGYDPECFILDTKNNRVLPPSYMWGLGTKDRPYSIGSKGIKVQRDGCAIEFNVNPAPLVDNETNSRHVDEGLSEVQKYIDSHYETADTKGRFKLHFEPVAVFDKDVWKHIRDEDKVLGCDPDFNAWTEKLNDVPTPPKEGMRTAAGHIHIGWGAHINKVSARHVSLCSLVAKELDATVGIMSVLIDPNNERREMYGKAGAFRPKEYGMEYRVPSNVWIKADKSRRAIIGALRKALDNCMKHKLISTPDVQRIINTSDTRQAYAWAEEHKLQWRKAFVPGK